MQANGSLSDHLSDQQFATLQTVFTFLEAATTALDVSPRPTEPSDLELTQTIRDLGLYCRDRMLQAFPALAVWRAIGSGE
jgi:hypothetical protein